MTLSHYHHRCRLIRVISFTATLSQGQCNPFRWLLLAIIPILLCKPWLLALHKKLPVILKMPRFLICSCTTFVEVSTGLYFCKRLPIAGKKAYLPYLKVLQWIFRVDCLQKQVKTLPSKLVHLYSLLKLKVGRPLSKHEATKLSSCVSVWQEGWR